MQGPEEEGADDLWVRDIGMLSEEEFRASLKAQLRASGLIGNVKVCELGPKGNALPPCAPPCAATGPWVGVDWRINRQSCARPCTHVCPRAHARTPTPTLS